MAALGAPPDDSRGAGEAKAELLFNEPATRRGAGAAPTRRAARILAGYVVARRSKPTAGILPPTASPARTAAHPAKIRGSAAIRAVREGLRLLKQRDDLWKAEVRSKIKQGMDSIRAGRSIPAQQVK